MSQGRFIKLYRLRKAASEFLKGTERQVTLVRGDVEDSDQLIEIVREHKVDGIIHAAAVTPELEVERKIPSQVMRINFMGTLHVLDAARLSGVQRVVYVSSDAVYGNMIDPNKTIAEDDISLMPENLYGIAKVASESVCRRYRTLYDLEVAAGRVCSTYGPMERVTNSRKGMSPIYQIADAVLHDRVLSVRGVQVVRTWTHVQDIALGLVAMLKTPSLSYSAYNISYGRTYSLLRVLTEFQNIEPTFRYRQAGDGDTADISYDASRNRGSLDIRRLRQDVGYEPKYDIETGIRVYMDWWRSLDRAIPM